MPAAASAIRSSVAIAEIRSSNRNSVERSIAIAIPKSTSDRCRGRKPEANRLRPVAATLRGLPRKQLLDHSQARRADGYRAIRPEGAKQQGGFVRCVSASRPGGVRLQLLATSRLRPSELFPVPALLRCHCIPNSIVYEAGRAEEMTYEALLCSFLPSIARSRIRNPRTGKRAFAAPAVRRRCGTRGHSRPVPTVSAITAGPGFPWSARSRC
jgi:hypothetical protein